MVPIVSPLKSYYHTFTICQGIRPDTVRKAQSYLFNHRISGVAPNTKFWVAFERFLNSYLPCRKRLALKTTPRYVLVSRIRPDSSTWSTSSNWLFSQMEKQLALMPSTYRFCRTYLVCWPEVPDGSRLDCLCFGEANIIESRPVSWSPDTHR
jgi:hypothetical protein